MSEIKTCPHCKKTKLKSYVTDHQGKPIHFWCKKCKEEFYLCHGGELLTHKEFIQRKKDWQ